MHSRSLQPIFEIIGKTARQRGPRWPSLFTTKGTTGENQVIAVLSMQYPAQVQERQAHQTWFRGNGLSAQSEPTLNRLSPPPR